MYVYYIDCSNMHTSIVSIVYLYLVFTIEHYDNEKHYSANPRRNLTEMLHLHVLGEHTGMKAELYQTNVKSQGFIYRASFQHRLH